MRVDTPYVPTRTKICEMLVKSAALKPQETVYDIGAGDGRILIAAKRAQPGIRAVGFEIALAVWLLGKLRILLSGQNVELRLADAMREDLSDADVIFLYLGPEMMWRLQEKFDRELRPGTRVLSHFFKFPGKEPVREDHIKVGRRDRTLLTYQW
jgi:precorrin-6B methylase 2